MQCYVIELVLLYVLKGCSVFETLGNTHPSTQCHIPEDFSPQQHNWGNLKSCILYILGFLVSFLFLTLAFFRILFHWLKSRLQTVRIALRYWVVTGITQRYWTALPVTVLTFPNVALSLIFPWPHVNDKSWSRHLHQCWIAMALDHCRIHRARNLYWMMPAHLPNLHSQEGKRT